MGNSKSIQKINFEDVQTVIKNKEIYLLINTLDEKHQDCLLPNTVNAGLEEKIVNQLLYKGKTAIKIVVYGKHCNDDKMYHKYNQLTSLGFYNVYLYVGGMFEWLLLQDIYGEKDFPTTKKELDLLRFKPGQMLDIALLEY
jgi:hypothetical protein